MEAAAYFLGLRIPDVPTCDANRGTSDAGGHGSACADADGAEWRDRNELQRIWC